MTHRSFALVVASLAFANVAAVQPVASGKPATHCECMNWKTTYEQGLARCGQGHEFSEFNPAKTPLMYRTNVPDAQKKVCENFFAKLDFNYCVSMSPGSEDGTWCYVDKECGVLTGGTKLANVSWKQCAKSDTYGHYRMTAVKRDTQLRDFALGDLYKLSQEQDLWFGGLVKMAYPGARAGENEPVSLKDFSTGIPVWADQHLRKKEFATTPYWFDTDAEGTLPIVVVADGKAFKVDKSSEQEPAHPRTWASFTCLSGC